MMSKAYLDNLKKMGDLDINKKIKNRCYTDLNFEKFKYKLKENKDGGFVFVYKGRLKSTERTYTIVLVMKKEDGEYRISFR